MIAGELRSLPRDPKHEALGSPAAGELGGIVQGHHVAPCSHIHVPPLLRGLPYRSKSRSNHFEKAQRGLLGTGLAGIAGAVRRKRKAAAAAKAEADADANVV